MRAAPHLVIGVSTDGQIAAIGHEVPDGLALELQAAVVGAALSPPATAPASIARCKHLLKNAVGPVVLWSGPGYVIPLATAFASGAQIHRSDGEDTEALRNRLAKGSDWSVKDWNQLLDGSFGPWAVATVGGQVIAICHCARLTDHAAEAGVWTDPDFRGQGHAAAVTAAWSSLLAPSGRHLFYSTSAGNRSSQRVAARLHLHPIGWMWKLAAP